jgi:Tol biopolymer transport system component
MSVPVGTSLGVYQVIAAIGAGGMGEVYRARDTKLNRDVALKILPAEFASEPDRLARFRREAQVLASLNHPHIGHIYGFEESNGISALVLELVEGPTLADRIAHGPVALDDALPIARQIAEALEAAHELGIIHRDLKPANIKVRDDGTVKVLDFGLAKALEPASGTRVDMTHSPTITTPAQMTGVGTILGTAAYMSPEQAKGRPADRRSDVWAFGCVLFEMLTGRRVFQADDVADTMAFVLTKDPDWTRLPATTPPSIVRLLRRCLEKDRRHRLPDIGVARLEIDEAINGSVETSTGASRGRAGRLLWTVAGVSALAATVAVIGWARSGPSPQQTPWTAVRLGGSAVAMGPKVSPDGQLVAFQAMVDSLTQVAVLKPESGNWTILTRDRSRGWVTDISWSRDGTKLYFDRELDVPRGIFSVPVLGGDERLVLEDAKSPQMLPDGSLVVERLNADRRSQLYRFWPEGGRLQALNALFTTESPYPAFRVSPDGRRVVFVGNRPEAPDEPPHLYALDIGSNAITTLAPGLSIPMLRVPLALSPDSRSVVLDMASGDLHRIVSVPADGSPGRRELFTMTRPPLFLDVGHDGSVYTDQLERVAEITVVSLSGGTTVRLGTIDDGTINLGMAVMLSDGSVVTSARSARGRQLVVFVAGKESAPFVDSDEETRTPASMVGATHLAFVIGRGASETIALASVADRRITRRLSGPKGADITAIAASPDGKTIYYTAGGSVWTVAADDGPSHKLRPGDRVAVDARNQDLIVGLNEREGVRLVRVPIAGGPEQPIKVQAGVRVGGPDGVLSSTSVGKDGRILTWIASPASWFLSAGVIDPRTGHVETINLGYDADMPSPGWTPDGRVLILAHPMRSTLWRFTSVPNP